MYHSEVTWPRETPWTPGSDFCPTALLYRNPVTITICFALLINRSWGDRYIVMVHRTRPLLVRYGLHAARLGMEVSIS